MSGKRRDLFEGERRRCAAGALRHLEQWNEYREAASVGLYASDAAEFPTREIFEYSLALGKRVAFPYVREKKLGFRWTERWSDLRPGYRDIPEPARGAETEPDGLDLIFVPGVCFDRRGWRLGRGGGFYDRLFASLRRPKRAGLAYAFQLVEELPAAPHDRPVDFILTERGVFRP